MNTVHETASLTSWTLAYSWRLFVSSPSHELSCNAYGKYVHEFLCSILYVWAWS